MNSIIETVKRAALRLLGYEQLKLGVPKAEAAKRAFELAFEFAPKALPFVTIAGDIVTTLTPTGVDDRVWAMIKAKYPRLFDGSIQTADDAKLYALAVATEMLKAQYPELSTTVARTSAQLAYIVKKSEDAGA